MHRSFKIALGVVAPALLAVGCSDFLTGDKLSNNPNIPTAANQFQLLNGVQVGMTTLLTGEVPRALDIWMQQFAGTDRQYRNLDAKYSFSPDDFTSDFSQLYVGGGLVDIRKIEQKADSAGDLKFKGIAQVWEAIDLGTAASLWGDVPYTQAATGDPSVTPQLDAQADVYAHVQALLDTAISNLKADTDPTHGPGAYDLIYGGDASKWIAAAHTLKARYYMHMAEKDSSNYARALAQTDSGITSSANDFRTYQTANPGEENIWYQFMYRERDSYIRAGAFLVNLLKANNDPRLTQYFSPGSTGDVVGATPGQAQNGAMSRLSTTRGAPSFRQPVITWAENTLLRAEAMYMTGGAADQIVGLVNQVKNAAGAPIVPAGTTGSDLLGAIVQEEYISLFQNIEAWNAYKRTCYPNLKPVNGGTNIPRALYYGADEVNTNPNVPADRLLWNANDRSGGSWTRATGATCFGQTKGYDTP